MPLLAALTAILMWSSLAALTVSLAGIPPLYLTGLSLLIGGALSIPWMRHWAFSWRALATGTYGQFTYHVLYIVALRSAPPVSGPIGGAFYIWSYAMRRGDARTISVLSNATPILSTFVLFIVGNRLLSPSLLWAMLLVTLSSLVVFRRQSTAQLSLQIEWPQSRVPTQKRPS